MLSGLLQPVLKCMHFLHTISAFILNVSFCIGRTIILSLLQACNIARDILVTLSIIGEELYSFACELNTSIGAVATYITSSANGGISCALEAVGVFIKRITNFFVKTRLQSKLLATRIGSFLGDFFHLIRNALLLIADCAWWLITLLPMWLLYAIIAVGDFLIETITEVRRALVYTVQIIIDDVFRLTIGIAILLILWRNRRRGILKAKQFIRSCFRHIRLLIRRLFRRRANRTLVTPSGIQKRSPLLRSSTSPLNCDTTLDTTHRCVICKDRLKCVLLLPCKHLCLCEECANLVFSSQRQNCPLCRTHISNSMSVFI